MMRLYMRGGFSSCLGWWWLRVRGAAIFFYFTMVLAAQGLPDSSPFPTVSSKKGLQVQMVDDALALGIKHAALNVNFGQMLDIGKAADSIPVELDGKTFYVHKRSLEQLDRQIKPLSDAGVIVSLILLYYRTGNAELDKLMLHPKYDPACPNNLSAFNVSSPDSIAAFQACVEVLARRYSGTNSEHGRVWNYILGNEVNSHWFWSNMGRVSMEEFADDYLKAMRVSHTGLRKYSKEARLYVSLEHHWNIHYPGGDQKQTFAAKPFLQYLSRKSREGGDFDWQVAFHPYPENLFECRTWNDKSATFEENTPRITFKNLELLPKFLRTQEMLYQGKPRRIILSEQGFHSPENEEGEKLQAAAYAYAYYKTANLPEIDSFILHRHVDHGQEGGLNLGLWSRRKPGAHPAQPDRKKPIYEVFKQADTAGWEKAFAFALPIIKIERWSDLLTPLP